MKHIKTSILSLAVLSLTGCAVIPSDAGQSFMINKSISSGVATTSTASSKEGRACAENILGMVILGDSSINTAKKNGGITKVSSVDKEIEQYVVYGKACTVVRGN